MGVVKEGGDAGRCGVRPRQHPPDIAIDADLDGRRRGGLAVPSPDGERIPQARSSGCRSPAELVAGAYQRGAGGDGRPDRSVPLVERAGGDSFNAESDRIAINVGGVGCVC